MSEYKNYYEQTEQLNSMKRFRDAMEEVKEAEAKAKDTKLLERLRTGKPGGLIEVSEEEFKALGRLATSGALHDAVNAPSHYLQTKISPLEVIEDWKLDFHLGSVIKYIGRHLHKGAPLEDLKKAQWYLARKIKLMEDVK